MRSVGTLRAIYRAFLVPTRPQTSFAGPTWAATFKSFLRNEAMLQGIDNQSKQIAALIEMQREANGLLRNEAVLQGIDNQSKQIAALIEMQREANGLRRAAIEMQRDSIDLQKTQPVMLHEAVDAIDELAGDGAVTEGLVAAHQPEKVGPDLPNVIGLSAQINLNRSTIDRKASRGQSTGDLVTKFQEAYNRLDYAAAAEIFERSLENDPRSAFRYFVYYASAALSKSLFLTGRTGAVAQRLGELIADQPYLHYLSLPGDPADLERIVALRQSRIDQGLPSMLIVTQPKSGSVSVSQIFNSGFNLPSVCYSMVIHNVIDSWAVDYARGGACYGTHLIPSRAKVEQLKRAGIDKIIVHVRDPRQALVSFAHHVDRYSDQVPEWTERAGTVSARASQMIAEYKQFIDWISGWVNLEKDISILFSTFEQYVANKEDFVERYLEFYNGDRKNFSYEDALGQHQGVDYHFRLGSTDEWRKVLNPALIKQISAMLPNRLKVKFSWQ